MHRRLYIIAVVILFFPKLIFSDAVNDNEVSESVHELVQRGTTEQLRQACRERSLDDTGTHLELRQRLLNYELIQSSLGFELRLKDTSGDDIILRHADFVEYVEDVHGNDLVLLKGSVDILYAGKTITADEITINVDSGIITGSGNITFIDGEKTYKAERFYYNSNNDEGRFFNAKTKIEAFTYTGTVIKKVHESEKFVAEKASLTTCDLKNPHYRVDAEQLYIYDEDKVLIKNARFYYGDDALFVLPYFYKSLKKPAIRSSLYFRERSGIVSQNTYYPLETDKKELKLKGDFYERLGVYFGADYTAEYPSGSSTDVEASVALSNDVYYHEEVTENWSPYGPPNAEKYDIDRDRRYSLGLYQNFRFTDGFTNNTEFNIYWVSDPYYQYDYERRKEQFDVFDLIGQAAYDYPQKGSGFTWFLNNHFLYDSLSFSAKNSIRFEPQRNIGITYAYLTDYYEHKIYTLTAPDVVLSHQKDLFSGWNSVLLSDISYRSSINYNHTIYYDENETPSSQIQKAGTQVGLEKDYSVARYVQFTPALELGAHVQHHTESDSTQLTDDRQNSLIYGRTTENLTVGSSDLYLLLYHDLKYKLYGPRDYYEYGSFRIHNMGVKGYAHWKFLTEQLTTSVDLRPVYDWQANIYEPIMLDRSRFSPLINTLTITPFTSLSLIDQLVYDIAGSKFKSNSFILNYSSKAIYLGNREITVSWELDWAHNFVNPFLDTLRSTFGVTAQVHPYWTVYLSVLSRNDDIWKYYKSGDEKINPAVDFLKSFNFFNIEDRKESNFKMKSISLGFVHDLHDWEMRFDYTGNRELSYDGSKYIWNNTYSISIGLKEVRDLLIHTKFSERD